LSKEWTIFILGGNLGKPQGTEFLLPVIDEMSLTDESTFLLIVGDGTDYEKRNNWFIKKPKNAKLMESLPREECDKLVSASDVGLFYSENYLQFQTSHQECTLM